eukprot:5099008-Amphidinium_carterae.2
MGNSRSRARPAASLLDEGQALQSHHGGGEESGTCARERGLSAVKKSWLLALKWNYDVPKLKHAPEECKRDPEVVLAAVRQDGFALEFAAEECKRDRDIVLEAVRQHGYALKFAVEEYKKDREIVLEAVRHHAWALRFAAEECKRDREIVLAA